VPEAKAAVNVPTAPPRHLDPEQAALQRAGLAGVLRRAGAWPGDALAALLWTAAILPAAMGYWLVGGSLAGVSDHQVHTLVAASFLALGLATLLQVALGFRLPMYEGPASVYLAAVTVVSSQGHQSLSAITGGLLAAGGFVALLGVLRVDRLMARVFTPLVANVFLFTVTLAVLPATLERAVGATHGLPGQGAAWASTLVVVAVTLAMRRQPQLTPYIMLVALVLGTATYLALSGMPHAAVGGGLALPALLPWGGPRASAAVVVPFLLAGALAAFNTVASGAVVAVAYELKVGRNAPRTALMMHGAAQAGGALLGNLVGTVSRLDSVGIVRLLNHRGRAPLLLMGLLIGALAFVRPVVDLAAALPLSVSGAVLGVLLAVLLAQALSGIGREPRSVRALVVAPALIPTAAWIAVGSSLAPTVQLVANPMLWGVLLAAVLERLVSPRAHRLEALEAGAPASARVGSTDSES
jgi:xanthine/uracil permease